ncbi:hypothetical protein [Pontibacter roseus]|uniref:hypothetical protein n=1 Tax=Pontibacter roseus TaxID=336989 RepID=UPI000379A577|nr:hypothetical protein [Pontibacter roseus]
MPYRLIDNQSNKYGFYTGEAFTDYDASSVLIPYFIELFDNKVYIDETSVRKGRGNRSEKLLKLTFSTSTNQEQYIYLYCFQTESGGRWRLINNGQNEARVQWRASCQWEPSLSNKAVAKSFADGLLKGESLENKRCFILSVYRRDELDKDIVISGIYPTQAQDVETRSTTNKSIQYNYSDIQKAYKEGISITHKTNDHLVIHFKPSFLSWYLLNSDKLHALDEYQFNENLKASKENHALNISDQFLDKFTEQVLEGRDVKDNYAAKWIVGATQSEETSNDTHFNLLLTEGRMLEALQFLIKERASRGQKVDIIQAKRIVQARFISLKDGK